MRQKVWILVVLCAVAFARAEDDQLFSTACKGAKHGSFIRSGTSCSHYLYCTNGEIGYEGICTKGLVFNPIVQTCGDISKADCTAYYSVEEEVKQQEKEEVVKVEEEVKAAEVVDEQPCKNAKDLTFIEHLHTCDQYYFCDKGIAHEGKCPEGFVFNTDDEFCDYPENVECDEVVVCEWSISQT